MTERIENAAGEVLTLLKARRMTPRQALGVLAATAGELCARSGACPHAVVTLFYQSWHASAGTRAAAHFKG